MTMSASKKSPAYLGTLAFGLVLEERNRQIEAKGYTHAHDDTEHGSEELAAAAAFHLLPAWMNPDVCTASSRGGLELTPLQEVVGQGAWEGISRDHDDPQDDLELRIRNVIRGCALGLAELERLVRIQKGGR